ncbi:MAG: CaiB/BaiF CoA transferase family protein [Vulcanimicrobiaceae bacterium]
MSGEQSPLAGMRVLEFGHIAAAPFCGMLLADLGADVVKIEPPSGDGLRAWPPLVEDASGERYSLNFASMNRGKRSVVANLKKPDDLARVRKLCAVSDVVLENYRPGVLARLGLGFDDVAKLQKRIVYCSVSGYGQSGGYAERGAFDVVIQGMSGMMSVTGEEGGPPVKCGVPVADVTAALYAALSILAARGVALRENRAIHLDCPMLDCLLGVSALQTSEYWGTGIAPKRLGSAHPRNAPYQAYDAGDAPFIIAAGNDGLWEQVCEAVGMRELLGDLRFSSVESRAKNQKALAAILQEVFRTHTAAHWIAEFQRRGVPCGPVNSFADILADPELVRSGLIRDLPVPVAGTTKTVAYPVRMNGNRAPIELPPPKLGEHTEEVFSEWATASA